MKTRILRLSASVPVLIAIGSFGWAGQQQTDEERFRKMVENEQASAAPVQEHQRLSALVGKWDMEIKLFPGPLNFVLPWLPIRAHPVLGRRALGVSCFILATLHMICYLGPTIRRNWRELYTPGKLWITGV